MLSKPRALGGPFLAAAIWLGAGGAPALAQEQVDWAKLAAQLKDRDVAVRRAAGPQVEQPKRPLWEFLGHAAGKGM